MTVVEEMERFSGQFGKRLVVNRASWHYYRLGTGPPVLWLSTGPADYGRAWLPAEKVFMVLARILPERTVKGLLAGGLLRAITLPEAERAEWVEAIKSNRAQRSVPCRRGLAFCRCLRPDPHWRRDPRHLPYLDRSHRRPQRRERSDAEQEGCSALHEPVWSRHRRDQPGPSGARRCTGRPE
jgi:hypothetical protein